MRRIDIAFWVVGLAGAVVAPAQNFDVATVKAHPAGTDGRITVHMGGGPGTPDPGRLNYENVTLKNVLAKAFNVLPYQLTVPAWAESERFDITAKVPEGTTKEQFGLMLQNLIADRFKMTFHREKKDLAAYVLVVAKNGPKMKTSEGAAPPPSQSGMTGAMQMGRDGFPFAPKGAGNYMMMVPGKARLVANAAPVSQLVDMLANQVDRPIVDGTGLKGKYDITLEFAPEMRNNPGMPMLAGRGPADGGGGAAPSAPDGETAPSLFTAVQEQLGLKLESRKAPIDLIVIDHLEKTPAEN